MPDAVEPADLVSSLGILVELVSRDDERHPGRELKPAEPRLLLASKYATAEEMNASELLSTMNQLPPKMPLKAE